jgi:hypothetical protein
MGPMEGTVGFQGFQTDWLSYELLQFRSPTGKLFQTLVFQEIIVVTIILTT